MNKKVTDKVEKALEAERKTDASNRVSIEDLRGRVMEHVWQFKDTIPFEEIQRLQGGDPYANGYRDAIKMRDVERWSKLKRDKRDKIQNDIEHDQDGNDLQEIAGLSKAEIKRLRADFSFNEGETIEYYFQNKEDFFNGDGSINIQNYLLLRYLEFSDISIVKYFDLTRQNLRNVNAHLSKKYSENEIDELSEKAYTDWIHMHPKVD